MTDEERMRVECTECTLARTVDRGDPERPSEIVRRHGRETGHILRVSTLDADEDRLTPSP